MSKLILKKLVTGLVLAGVSAGTLVSAGAAQAQHYNGRHGGGGAGHHAPGPAVRHAPPPSYAPQHRQHHGHNNIGKGVAIGVGALILGGILASEANRRHHDGY